MEPWLRLAAHPMLKMKAGGALVPTPRAKDLVGTDVGTGDHSKCAARCAGSSLTRARAYMS